MESHTGTTTDPLFGSSSSSGLEAATDQLQQALSDEGLRTVVADLLAAASSSSAAASTVGKWHGLSAP